MTPVLAEAVLSISSAVARELDSNDNKYRKQ